MAKRPFSEISVVATGVQGSEGRFGKRRCGGDPDDVPLISGWRCNLTALSQEHNLYFVAYGRDIYVYVPRFPTQAVSRDPVLIVPSQPTSPGLRGYLDPHEPHSINHLIVQHLGRDEVIATVRDDGDVEAILVRHIVQAIRRRAEPDNAIGAVADEIKPIFQSNVGISAWGLAIHSEARIIATSSNAHEVRVFKFGLLHDVADDDELSDLGEEEISESESTDTAGHRDDRRQMDVTQRVLNGDANIPYISFCNTGDDPEGRWLLTTDISGYCRVMNLHGLSGVDVTAQQFRFGRSWPGSVSGFDRLNAGWAIMFLDLRSFQPEREFQAAVGLPENGTLPSSRDNNNLWDLSDTVETVPENSPAFVMNNPRRRRSREQPSISPRSRNPAQRSLSEALQPVEGTQSPDGDVVTPARDVQNEAAPIVASDENTTHNYYDDDDDDDDDDEEGGVPLESEEDEDVPMIDTGLDPAVEEIVLDVLDDLDGTATDSPGPESDEEPLYSDHPIALIGDGEDPDDEGTEDSISFNAMYGGKRLFGNQPYFLHQNSICDGLPCPILHASVKNVYLLQPSPPTTSSSNRRTSGPDQAANPFTPPMVGLANPLRQSIQNHFGYLNMYDRLNMHAYIPTLGIIILASQKGRALVLSLTKLPKGSSTSYPPEMRDQRRKTVYAMRVECILPFERQEKDGARPFAPLHGIAAAPVQGGGAESLDSFCPQGKRRWRVMLMYQDHSVLSYEFSRQRGAGDGAGGGSTTVDFGQLVV
ncbi:hypothetical protein KC360_g4449 [Hortaea werneckii]|nr:hypothetical protein KC361_g2187 [Hortaea werneckii]KAI6889298.1 hypothetical protein KC325_g630 [Hortaea werneckii]KAI7001115.1 hypothetical protein KC359_g824 [Hortaea werneckii]KAI7145465.1 hypothetical protein KC344_g4440 [Hortaea werneckii]KAI7174241.1 hypothetical protein KC360_g4449 [Hortaea werneckii]